MPEERSPLQTIAVICVKLDQGEPEEKIREYLDIGMNCLHFVLNLHSKII